MFMQNKTKQRLNIKECTTPFYIHKNASCVMRYFCHQDGVRPVNRMSCFLLQEDTAMCIDHCAFWQQSYIDVVGVSQQSHIRSNAWSVKKLTVCEWQWQVFLCRQGRLNTELLYWKLTTEPSGHECCMWLTVLLMSSFLHSLKKLATWNTLPWNPLPHYLDKPIPYIDLYIGILVSYTCLFEICAKIHMYHKYVF